MKEAECYPGKRVGRLTLIEKRRIPLKDGHTQGAWLCHCDCGAEKVIRTYALGLKKGKTQSCGCYQRELTSKRSSSCDGDSREDSKYFRLYTAWCNMKARCYSKNNDDYQNYGARGIRVCDEWKNNYKAFKQWAIEHDFNYKMSGAEQSIDRINVDGNYEPSNCRWVDSQIQASNKTSNTYIWINGQRYTQQELARKYNMGHKTISYRVNHGWSDEEIIGDAYQNLDKSRQMSTTIEGETKTLIEWARISGVNIVTLRDRYRRGIRGKELLQPANQRYNHHPNPIKIDVNGDLLSFNELSVRTGINIKTLRERYAKGLRDNDLIAPPGKAPRIVKKKEVITA